MVKISVSARCPDCNTKISWDDDITDEAILVCKNCGLEIGTYGDFKKRATAVAAEQIGPLVKETFKRR